VNYLASYRCLVAEDRYKRIAFVTEAIAAREIETIRGRMHTEDGSRMRRLIGMIRKKKLRTRLAGRREHFLRERLITGIVRPAMPQAGAHFPKQIARAPHRPAATIIIAV